MFSSAVGMSQLLLVSTLGAGLPFGLPPAAEDPVVANVAPEECVLYLSWAGSSKPDAASSNQLEQLLAEPEVQLMMQEVEKMIVKAVGEMVEDEAPDAKPFVDLGFNWGRKLLTSPTSVFVESFEFGPDGPVITGGALINVGENAEELQKTLDMFLGGGGAPFDVVKIAGVDMYQSKFGPGPPVVTGGIKDGYFYIGIGDGAVEAMLERSTTPPPAWLSDLRKQLPVERTSFVGHVNTSKLMTMTELIPPGPVNPKAILDAIGLSDITSLGFVSGLGEETHETKMLIAIDGEGTGILQLANADSLTAADLRPIPADSLLALAVRLDSTKLMEVFLEVAGKIEPTAPEMIVKNIAEMEEGIGISLRKDVLESLGDVWCVYHSPGEGGFLTGLSAVVSVDDPAKLKELQATLLGMAKAMGDPEFGPRVRSSKFAGQTVFYVENIERGFPLSPSWCLTDSELIVSLTPQNIKAYLGRDEDYKSLASVPAVSKALASGKGPFKLYYQDTPALFEFVYPMVQFGLQMGAYELRREGIDLDVGILPTGPTIAKHLRPDVVYVGRTDAGIEVTAVQSAPGTGTVWLTGLGAFVTLFAYQDVGMAGERVAVMAAPRRAREMQSINNLKQIALAMHNYHDTYGKLPAAYSTDDAGKPLLSWRVHILPFTENAALYERFKLDEPWDSEHNIKLLPLMPEIYQAPGSRVEPGKTNYATVRGMSTLFPGDKGMRFRDVTDGLSNTIMAVEVADDKAVDWTKPADFSLDPMDPLRGLIGLRRNVFLTALGDGSVRRISADVDKKILPALFTRDGGEVIDHDALDGHHHDHDIRDIRGVPARAPDKAEFRFEEGGDAAVPEEIEELKLEEFEELKELKPTEIEAEAIREFKVRPSPIEVDIAP